MVVSTSMGLRRHRWPVLGLAVGIAVVIAVGVILGLVLTGGGGATVPVSTESGPGSAVSGVSGGSGTCVPVLLGGHWAC